MGNPFLTPTSTSGLVNAIRDKDMPWGQEFYTSRPKYFFLGGEGGGGEGRLYIRRSLEHGLIFRAAAGNRA